MMIQYCRYCSRLLTEEEARFCKGLHKEMCYSCQDELLEEWIRLEESRHNEE